MELADAVRRLQLHAGIPIPNAEWDEGMLSEWLWRKKRGQIVPELDFVIDDIFACLAVVNSHSNKFVGAPVNQDSFSRQLVYSISGIVALCLTKALESRTSQSVFDANELDPVSKRILPAWDRFNFNDFTPLHASPQGSETASRQP